jgi:hypothetical protein
MNASSSDIGGARYDDRPRSVTRPLVTTVILVMLVIMIVRDLLARRRRLAAKLLPEPRLALEPTRPTPHN